MSRWYVVSFKTRTILSGPHDLHRAMQLSSQANASVIGERHLMFPSFHRPTVRRLDFSCHKQRRLRIRFPKKPLADD